MGILYPLATIFSSILPHSNVIYNSKHKRLGINWLVSQSILCSIVSHLPWIIPYLSPSDFNMSFVHFTTYDWCDGSGSFCPSLLGKKEDEALLCHAVSAVQTNDLRGAKGCHCGCRFKCFKYVHQSWFLNGDPECLLGASLTSFCRI